MPSVVFAVIASSEESTMDARSAVWSSATSVDRFDIIFSILYEISGRMMEPRIKPAVKERVRVPNTQVYPTLGTRGRLPIGRGMASLPPGGAKNLHVWNTHVLRQDGKKHV